MIGVVCTIAPTFAQIAVLGCYISILSGLLFSVLESHKSHEQIIDRVVRQLGVVKEVWRDQELSQKYEQIVAGIAKALRIDDPLFRKLALSQIDSFALYVVRVFWTKSFESLGSVLAPWFQFMLPSERSTASFLKSWFFLSFYGVVRG